MTPSELDQLVAQIGDQFLARLGPGAAAPARRIAAEPPSRPATPGLTLPAAEIAAMIDHTLLRPEATAAEIAKLCSEARRYRFASVCINPYWVPLAVSLLEGSGIPVCTVTGFPLGATTTDAKRAETQTALRSGAREIDMVINVGALRSGDLDRVKTDIGAVVELTHAAGAIVKVIIEAALLNDEQKAVACVLSRFAEADFVKTSTGFGPHGATVHDVALMRAVVGGQMGVKAAGGIRTLEDFLQLAAAGANRIGASASVKIVEAAG